MDLLEESLYQTRNFLKWVQEPENITKKNTSCFCDVLLTDSHALSLLAWPSP